MMAEKTQKNPAVSQEAPQRGSESRQNAGKPRWIARFAAFVIPRCRDLPGSIDRITDRTRDPDRPWIAAPWLDEVGPTGFEPATP